MIRYGLFQGCFPREISMEDCLRLTTDLGYHGLEVTMEDPSPLLPEAIDARTEENLQIIRSAGTLQGRRGALTVDSSPAQIRELAALAQGLGVQMHSIAARALFFYTLSSPKPTIRNKGIEVVLKMLEAATLLGAETLLIIPGMVTPSVRYAEVFQRSQEALRYLESEARRRGIVLAIENVWNGFLLSPLEMARYIDELNSPYVGAYFDVANVLAFGYPEDWLRTLGPRVRAVHFKDFRREVGNIRGFTHLLHGDVDWPQVAAALRAIDYQGYVTLEVPALKVDAVKGLRDAKASLDWILAGQRG